MKNSEIDLHKDEQFRIVYLTHYYPPEVNAPAVRVSELASEWTRLGHEVTVITGFPNHPAGVIPPEYKGSVFREEDHNGVKLLRTWIHAAANKGFTGRILNFLSFMVSSLVLAGPRIKNADIIIGTSPQIFVAVSAWILSVWKRAPFVFEVRDIWPEEIRAVGAIRNRFILAALEWMEMFLYRRATRIVAVAQGTIDILKSRGVPAEKLVLIPNGVDVKAWDCTDRAEARRRVGMNGDFVVSYIGTHGMAHGLDTILEAARQLESLPRLRFLMVGDGAERKRLEIKAQEYNLKHVEFLGQMPRNRIQDYYTASDVCLVPLKKAKLFTHNIPSKIYEIMASSRPLVISTEGESRALVEAAGCGLAVEPENAEQVAAAIRTLYASPELGTQMGRDGRSYVERENDRGFLAKQFCQVLQHLIPQRGTQV